MDKFQHPIILCPYKLKFSSPELFGRHLALKSQLTLQVENEDGFKINFEHPKATYKTKLKFSSTSNIPQLKYELLLDDFKLFFYEDFIEILFKLKVDYYHLQDLYKRDDLQEIEFLKVLFELLKTLGVKEIYFGIFEEFGNGKQFKYKWKNVLREISGLTHFQSSF